VKGKTQPKKKGWTSSMPASRRDNDSFILFEKEQKGVRTKYNSS